MPTDQTPTEAPAAVPTPASAPGKKFSINLKRTGSAFVAEYSVFLIALSIVLGGLVWLASILGGLITSAMQGSGDYGFVPTTLMILWIAISSLIAMPVAAVFWSRTQGELAAAYNNEFPRGGARGFRSLWLTLSGLQAVITLSIMLYAPIAAAVSGGQVGHVMVSVVLPAFLTLVFTVLGVFIVASGTEQRKKVRIALWIAAILVALLVAITYPWSAAQGSSSPTPRQTEPADYPLRTSPDPYMEYDPYSY